MRPMALALALPLALALALLAPVAASAQDARQHFLRGEAAYNQGDYEAALREWQAAYTMDPRPLLQFNLAQAFERLGRLEEARDALDQYLASAPPDDPHQADARARLAAIRERLSRTAVRVEGGPEGATIEIDGEDRGRTPRPDPLLVEPGEHQIVVRLGERRFESAVVVPAGQSITVHVRMPESAAPGPAVVASGGDELPIAAIAVLSGAGVALLTGAILGGVAMSSAGAASTPDDANASTARGLAIGADVCFGVSLAAAAVGIVLAIVETSGGGGGERQPERIGDLELTPWGDGTGGGAAVSITF